MTQDAAASVPIAKHEFSCSVCGESAGIIELLGSTHDARIVRRSFTSLMTVVVEPSTYDRLCSAIGRGDAAALFQFDLELAPFYCPQCDASFCGAHWRRWDIFDDDGWHDSIRGACPAGHERMLED
jgi:hypothetical protein